MTSPQDSIGFEQGRRHLQLRQIFVRLFRNIQIAAEMINALTNPATPEAIEMAVRVVRDIVGIWVVSPDTVDGCGVPGGLTMEDGVGVASAV